MAEVTALQAERSERVFPVEAFEVELLAVPGHRDLLSYLGRAIVEQLDAKLIPIHLAVSGSSESGYRCELGVVAGLPEDRRANARSLFRFRRREIQDAPAFTTVHVVPTGIGPSIGGHGGDATPATTPPTTACSALEGRPRHP